MLCTCSRSEIRFEETPGSLESLATRDYSFSGITSKTEDSRLKFDDSLVDDAESSLKDSILLNYEEARALLGWLEYQRGNYEIVLQLFQGIDISGLRARMVKAIVESSTYKLLVLFLTGSRTRLIFDVEFTELSSPSLLEKIQQTVQNVIQTFNIFRTPVNVSDADNIQKEYDESNSKLSKIQSRVSTLTAKLKYDFGIKSSYNGLKRKLLLWNTRIYAIVTLSLQPMTAAEEKPNAID